MQITRLFATLAFFVAIGISSVSSGQIMGRPGQVAGQALGGSPYTSNPDSNVFDPGNLDYDMQPFAPLDISEFDEQVPFSGFHASYQRTYLSVSRPNPFGNINKAEFPTGADFQSGNKFAAGFMSTQGVGWDITYAKTSGSFFSEGNGEGVALPMFTTTGLHDLRLNRVFRQPLTKGGYIAPYFGVGYSYFDDETIQDFNGNFVDPADLTNPVSGLTRFKQHAKNSIIGGQVGMKLRNSRGRFDSTVDLNLTGGFNSQSYIVTEDQFAVGDDVFADGLFDGRHLARSGSAFTPVLNASFEMNYLLTRDVSIKWGGQVAYIWNGIHRANTLGIEDNPNSAVAAANGIVGSTVIEQQAVTIAGFSAGIEWRR